VPSFEDLADLVVRRCYEGLQSGRPTVSLQDAAAVIRLAWQIERDEAIPARDKALAELAEAQDAMLALKAAADPVGWPTPSPGNARCWRRSSRPAIPFPRSGCRHRAAWQRRDEQRRVVDPRHERAQAGPGRSCQ
jgi:hypothetical protein